MFELRNEEISVKKILAVINATYAVAKRKPEKIRERMRIVSVVIHYKAPINLDIFSSFSSL